MLTNKHSSTNINGRSMTFMFMNGLRQCFSATVPGDTGVPQKAIKGVPPILTVKKNLSYYSVV